ncbi:hypothetical protein L3Q82_020237 [Scortum barcoo]|uniref:Uncharacterized protein n=1 Tax=Scortum barcoo TaxID=214431 RepID=A0ACB8V8R7_9TELE|nr:hypothetical protein L3Q82_020237 [Scortum barcoo]
MPAPPSHLHLVRVFPPPVAVATAEARGRRLNDRQSHHTAALYSGLCNKKIILKKTGNERERKKRGVFVVRGTNENLDPRSVHSSVIGHACHAAAEASLSVLFVPVTSGSGWMKLGAQEARRLR